jgi:hypothetical protein
VVIFGLYWRRAVLPFPLVGALSRVGLLSNPGSGSCLGAEPRLHTFNAFPAAHLDSVATSMVRNDAIEDSRHWASMSCPAERQRDFRGADLKLTF